MRWLAGIEFDSTQRMSPLILSQHSESESHHHGPGPAPTTAVSRLAPAARLGHMTRNRGRSAATAELRWSG